MNWSIQYKIAAGFALSLIALIYVSHISFRTTNQLIGTADSVTHSHEMLKKLESLLSKVRDVEAGSLGYVITADEYFLKPFQFAEEEEKEVGKNIPSFLENQIKQQQKLNAADDHHLKPFQIEKDYQRVGEEIMVFLKDQPEQQRKLQHLYQLVLEHFSIAREMVDLRKQMGFEQAVQRARTNGGKNLMSDIQNVIDEMVKAENHRLEERDIEAKKSARRTSWSIFLSASLAFAFIAIASFIIHREISERRRAEIALRENEQRLQALMDNSTALISIKDIEGRYILANHRYEELFKTKIQDMVGKTDEEVFPEETASLFRKDDSSVAQRKVPMEFEESVSYGNKIHTYISIKFPLMDANKNLYAICGILTDITERKEAKEALQKAHHDLELRVKERTAELAKINEDLRAEIAERNRAEKALRESEERFRTLFEDARIGMAILGLDYRYLKVNKTFCEMLGYTEEELKALTFIDLTPEEDRQRDQRLAERVFKEEIPSYKIEKRYLSKDQKIIWVNLTAMMIHDSDGKSLYGVSIVEDITERKLLEEQFRQSQKMEVAGKLAGGVAHDFNNMLNVILGYSSLALQSKLLDVSLRPKIEAIQSAGKKATQITRQLLAFSRHQVLEPQVININHYVQESATMVGQLIGENIQVETILEPELWRIKVDPGYLDQIILNLVVNARDAMPDGGNLTIQTTNLVMNSDSQHMSGPYVMLSIKDTGCGMTPEIQSRIFEPFFTTKEVGRGTGLGLSTVYGIVRQSGGHIEVNSEVGKGATFKIYFPRTEDVIPMDVKAPSDVKEGTNGKGTILVVENEDSLRELVREILTNRGYTVVEARYGEEALEACKKHDSKIDIVFTDVIMPKMGGMELAERLRALAPNIKVVFTSGYAQDDQFYQKLADSRLNFIAKPYEASHLVQKVQEILLQTGGAES